MMRFIVGWIVSQLLVTLATGQTSETALKFKNDSHDWLSIHWVDPRNGKPTLIKDSIAPQQKFNLNSYVGHHFEVWQELDPATGLCGSSDGNCDKIGYVAVTMSPEEAFVIREGVKVESAAVTVTSSQSPKVQNLIEHINLDDVEDPTDILYFCKDEAAFAINKLDPANSDYDSKVAQVNEKLHDCITVGLAPRIKASDDEVIFERNLRLEASNIAENVTCVNTDLESSPDVETEEWKSSKDGVMRIVHHKLDRPASRIHVVSGFASPEECDAMTAEAQDNLHAASTADGKGGAKVSAARKAMQAGIKPQFTEDGEPLDGNLISTLSKRVYEYTNHALDMNLTHHGQEPLMSIQYFGRGRHDIEPDRYTPHCDGKCDGEQHMAGGRMATMVIYCELPQQGGFTNFQNANVHVRPQAGDAVFFSYFDPLTNVTDFGLTQHSGCPVYEGEKKIITQWVRYGVSRQKPHSAFNTLGKLVAEDGE
eukprot:CAMPEP_0116086704 /NCGR_PEP_ID=MMETSP0327-20121206/4992_1 /TAXON_ID=44447 /ORGANISM="Pseudo-nitzschia delicatissima, Strain B596" /LENGTH=480 /DNA_ID=CAMNT_0003577763 /DNA_START=36 /DNA_END=1478 /DNA_ORIENTATION=-